MRIIKSIVLHHSATASKAYEADLDGSIMSKNICAAHYRNWVQKFPNYVCDYHFLIGSTGTVFKGQPLEQAGWHCGVYEINLRSIGICLLGNFEETIPPMEQVNALLELLVKLIKEYDIKIENIKMHNQIVNTLCPGKNFPYRFILSMVKIKEEVEDEMTEAEEAIKFVRDNNIMKPFETTQYFLEEYFEEFVTKEELAIFLYRFYKKFNPELKITGTGSAKNYTL